MRIALIGTGTAHSGPERARTSALLDRTLLVDFGPDTLAAASRHNISLAGVRTLLLTDADPRDTWVTPVAPGWPLEVVGPDEALDDWRALAAAQPSVTVSQLHPGGQLRTASGHSVTALSAARGVGQHYVIDDLLIAWGSPAPITTQVRAHGPYSTVLLAAGGATHESLQSSLAEGATVIALRTNSSVGSPEGVQTVPDGTHLGPRRILVTGGTRSGKSRFAESLLNDRSEVTYIATGGTREGDSQWADRIQLHRQRRPESWRTIETLDVTEALHERHVLLDCLTLWLSRSMFSDNGEMLNAPVDALLQAIRTAPGTIVIVTSEVGSGVIAPSSSGRAFTDALGALNCAVAAECDEVWHCVAGIPTRLSPMTG